MQLIFNGDTVDVADFAEASAAYAAARDASGEGMRTWPDGEIVADGQPVARVSYNAKIWPPEPWVRGQAPLYDPYRAAAA